MQRPNIFDFSDYRQYLNAFYQYKKGTDYTFTYAKFSKKVGIKSPNYLKLIKDNKRNLTTKNLHRFSLGLELGEEERKYFEHLVGLAQASSTEEKILHLKEMQSLIGKFPERKIHPGIFNELFSSFATFMVREMVRLKDFQDDEDWIQKKLVFYLAKNEIKKILATLIEQGLLSKDEKGRLSMPRECVVYTRDIPQAQVAEFHLKNISESLEILRTLPFDRRDMNSSCSAIERAHFPEMCRDLFAAVTEIVKKYEEKAKHPDTVVQVNSQIFQIIHS